MAVKEVLLNNNFILSQNDEVIRKLEKYVKCPRCKNNLRCYRRKILTLDKEKCKNVCDHCLNGYLFHKSSSKDKRAISREYSPVKYNKNKVKLWLSRIIDLLENNLILYKTANLSKQAQRRALLSTESRYKPHKFHEPELDQMFDFRIKSTERKGTPESIINREIRYADDDDIVSFHKVQLGNKSDDNSVEIFRDDATISSSDSRYKKPVMLQEKLQVLKQIINRDSEDQDPRKSNNEKYRRISTAKQRNYDNNQKDVLPNYVRSETKIQNIRKHISTTSLRRFNSFESITTSLSGLTEKTLEQNFTYFFPKEERGKKPVRRHKSSSEIIKDTIDMLSERAELEKKKKDEIRRKKLEDEEKKRLARLEKQKQKLASEIKLADEKKEVTFSAEEKDQTEKESIPLKTIKSAAVRQKTQPSSESESKSSEKSKKNLAEKPHKEKSKKDTDSPVKEEPKKDKDKSTKDKSSKENLKKDRLAEKEQKMKEKEQKMKEKEQKMKEKEEKEKLLKIEKEKKLQEKAEREEKLRLEKEEKEKLKKQKAEQLQAAKEKPPKGEKVKEKIIPEKDNNRMDEKAMAEKKLKEEAFSKMAEEDQQPQKKEIAPKTIKEEQTTFKELNVSQVKLRKHSQDNLILQLVQLKQSQKKERRERPTRLSEVNVSPIIFRAHQNHAGLQDSSCILCRDSELELDVDNILFGGKEINEPTDVIMGQKIVKVIKSPRINKKESTNILFEPLLFKSTFFEDSSPRKSDSEKVPQSKPTPPKRIDAEAAKGIIRYALSDRSFIDKGWTMLPTEKVVRKMNVYRMRPAHPEFDWFEHNKNKKLMEYETGEKLAEFDDDGKGRWYYRNGRLALDYYDAEETNAQQRFVIYSNGEPDDRGRARPFTILATFDYLGNGVVFDHSGKIRLKYNQTEGVVLDRSIGPVSHWKWHTLNDPPVLQQVMIDTQMAHKDPDILKLGGHGDEKPRHDNEEMLAIEFDNFIKEKSKKLTQKFKPFQIKMKALKINENFSLKVLDQATVYLIFRDGSTNLKLNIGMILDHKEIVDTDTAEVGEVSNSLERFPAKTDSLAGLQYSVAHAQRVERARLERERRLRPSQSNTSADKLVAAASKPLRQPFRTVIPSNTTSATMCYCKYRKPSNCNIYYDTRLV